MNWLSPYQVSSESSRPARSRLFQAVLELERQAAQLQTDYTNRDGIRRQVTDVIEYRRCKAELAEVAGSLRELESRVAEVSERPNGLSSVRQA